MWEFDSFFFGSTSVKSLNGHGSGNGIWTWRWGWGGKYRKSGMGPRFSSGNMVIVPRSWIDDIGYAQAETYPTISVCDIFKYCGGL